MNLPLNPRAYRQLVAGDLLWLRRMPDTCERRHIEMILERQLQDAERVCRADSFRASRFGSHSAEC